jgi:flavodoxin
MMFEVVYYSRSGNTEKVAGAIARELGVTARDVRTAGILPPNAFVFLGTGCYGTVLPGAFTGFMKQNRFDGREIALFTTSAFGSEAERSLIREKVTGLGAEIKYSYSCLGRWMSVKKQHPTPEELEKAREFARQVIARQSCHESEIQKAAVLAR